MAVPKAVLAGGLKAEEAWVLAGCQKRRECFHGKPITEPVWVLDSEAGIQLRAALAGQA